MGIRIKKEIGYFLNKDLASKILVPNYKEILEGLDYNDNNEVETFKSSLSDLVSNYEAESTMTNSTESMIMRMLLKRVMKIAPLELIREIYHFDDNEGILFITPDLVKYQRFDDLIDYYEHFNNQNFECRHLNMPIYPMVGWIYAKEIDENVPEAFRKEMEKEGCKLGDIIDSDLMSWLVSRYYENTVRSEDRLINIKKMSFFLPNVDPMAYLIAKAAGILNENVDEFIFRTTVKPAIISNWG